MGSTDIGLHLLISYSLRVAENLLITGVEVAEIVAPLDFFDCGEETVDIVAAATGVFDIE